MTRALRLHPAAQRELDEAAAYYDAESPGLGGAFLSEFDHALQQIRAFPEAAPIGLGSLRVRVLVTFPYSLHYAQLGDAVLVLSLAHQAGGRSTGVTGSRPVGGANKRIKLTRRSAGGLTGGRCARSLSAVRWTHSRGWRLSQCELDSAA